MRPLTQNCDWRHFRCGRRPVGWPQKLMVRTTRGAEYAAWRQLKKLSAPGTTNCNLVTTSDVAREGRLSFPFRPTNSVLFYRKESSVRSEHNRTLLDATAHVPGTNLGKFEGSYYRTVKTGHVARTTTL